MAIPKTELDASVDSAYQDSKTAFTDELWQDGGYANLQYAAYTPSNRGWGDYMGRGKLEIYDPTDFIVPAEVEPLKAISFSNKLFDGFHQAVRENKPLIVEFSQASCDWCKKLDQETMTSPEVRAFADKAVWVRVDPRRDEDDKGNVGQLQKDLKIDRFPTTVVLDVSSNSIVERGRIIGYFEPQDFANNLRQILPKDAPRTRVAGSEQPGDVPVDLPSDQPVEAA